jgi:hypothetical protein
MAPPPAAASLTLSTAPCYPWTAIRVMTARTVGMRPHIGAEP